MTENNEPVVNWLDFDEPQKPHVCDCGYCEFGGGLEGEQYRMLRVFRMEGVEYASDRFLALRRDLAPVPDGYPAHVSPGVDDIGEQWGTAGDIEPEPETPFLWHIAREASRLGWSLRRDEGDRLNRWVIRDEAGSHIGWAMSARQPQTDERDPGHTWSYSMIRNLAGASS